MSFTFLILAVGVEDKLKIYIDLLKGSISDIGGETVDVHYISCDLFKIKTYLKTSCDTNKANIIVIIGENDENKVDEKTKSDIVYLATKAVISKVICKKTTPIILELETKLQMQLPQAVCGRQNKTLILNMFGNYLIAVIFLKTNGEKLLEIIDMMIYVDINYNNKYTYEIDPSHAIVNSCLTKIRNIIEEYKKTSSPIVSVYKATQIISKTVLKYCQKVQCEYVSVHNAYGRILLKDMYSQCNVPSFRTSAKHGFAIIANDGSNRKKILETETTFLLEPGTCVWVKPGAPLPDGTTAVIQEKNTKKFKKNNIDDTEKKEEEIEIIIQPKEGENIKDIGCEIKTEEKILNKYIRIGPVEIGLLACCGISEIAVIKHQTVGILSIGNELEEPGMILKPKRMYDSNRLTLITLLKQEGFDCLDFGIVNDDVLSIICKLQEALEKVNVIVAIGSANDKDLLKPILQGYFDATIHFGNVNMKPGKSTTFATFMHRFKRKYILCLSKNPAVILIAARLFLLPLLNSLRYFRKEYPIVSARIQTEPNLHSRPRYIYTSLKWNQKDVYPWIHNTDNYINNVNALLRLPPRTEEVSKLLPDAFITTTFVGSK